ncbi:hypothetical protein SDC9_128298 [bioreactor metagenome]|uniref:Winged helix-turn-helix domain-containing protein n=1 Tax=bioreactor metagenome TaxID=1076179 RepID=A0A645CVT8_9ZZZZ|nr:helix-turn-helix domain-containing protein [Aminobacterium sp.]MEA4876806.1 helix-turn-helix domain-containing protein [Aminobacterium sp.]
MSVETVCQCEQLQEALERGERITALEALRRFGCLRLSARIYDLKKRGVPIESETVKRNGKQFKEYFMGRGN